MLLAYPVLSRLYEPADFGLLVVFSAVVGMIAVVSTASLEAAIPLPADDRAAAAVAWAGLAAVGITTALTTVVGAAVATPVAELLGTPDLARLWWLVPVTTLAMGLYAVFSEWMIRERSYGALGRRNFVQGAGQVGVQLGLGVLGARPIGLLLGLTAGRFLSTGSLAVRAQLVRHRPRPAEVWAAVVRYRRFPLIASWSKFLNAAGLDAPILLIAAVYGDAQAGLLGLAIRVIGGPAAVIGQAVHQVFTGETSLRIREPSGRLGGWVRKQVLLLLAVGAGPAMLLVLLGPQLFEVVFGPEWGPSGEFARILAVSYLASFAIVPISHTLFLLERQGVQLAWDSGRLAFTVGAIAACASLGASMTVAVTALTIAHVAGYVALYVLAVRAADRSDTDRGRSR